MSGSNLRGITSIDVSAMSKSRVLGLRKAALGNKSKDTKDSDSTTNSESLRVLDAKVAKLLLRTNKSGREGKTRLLEALSKRLGAIMGVESKLIKKSENETNS